MGSRTVKSQKTILHQIQKNGKHQGYKMKFLARRGKFKMGELNSFGIKIKIKIEVSDKTLGVLSGLTFTTRLAQYYAGLTSRSVTAENDRYQTLLSE